MAFLKVITGPNTGQIWELRDGKVVLGRHPDCNIPIHAPDASRFHAQMLYAEGQFCLEDLRSRNGTYVNDRVVRGRCTLRDGDQLRIAGIVFRFHERNLSEPTLQAPPAEARLPAPRRKEGEPPLRPEPGLPPLLSSRPLTAIAPMDCGNPTCRSQVKALLSISQSLRRTVALDAVLPQLLETLFLVFPAADRGIIALADDKGNIVPRWVKIRSSVEDRDSSQEVHLSRSVVRRVMETQEAVLTANVPSDDRVAASRGRSSEKGRSMMCAPLVDGGGKSFGVMLVDSLTGQRSFDEHDLEIFLSVTAQAAVAIDNAQFYEQALRDRTQERSLELAEQIQRSLLPQQPPEVPGYEFFDYYQPAERVGGDFYDYLRLPDGRVAIVMADVVEHGIPAAMLTAKLAAEIRLLLLNNARPEQAVTQLNVSLAQQITPDHFVTLLLAILTPLSNELTLINAGHMPPIIRLPDGQLRDVVSDSSHLPLAVSEGTQYEATRLQLSPGSLVLMYTNGVNEALSVAQEAYGVDRLRRQLPSPGGACQAGQRILDDLRQFLSGAAQADDMCLVCFGRLAGP